MDNIKRLEPKKFYYCANCPYFKFGEIDCGCYIGHSPKECPIAQTNKKWDEYEQAKHNLKTEIKKPFIKIIDWLKSELERFEKES